MHHTLAYTLTYSYTLDYQVYISKQNTHTTYGADTHTHTNAEETYHSLSRTQIWEGHKDKRKNKGADKVSFRFVALHKHPDSCFTDGIHPHPQTVKYTRYKPKRETEVCYIHLARQRGRKQNQSIAHCGTYQGDKKGSTWDYRNNIKTAPNPKKTKKNPNNTLL